MGRVILVTGATGLVGSALVLELLHHTDAEVVCLVRPKGSKRAAERMRQALEPACRLYGDQALVDEVHRRCSVLEGDVTQPGCGVGRAARRRIDEVWHCAALTTFERGREEEVHLTNVVGSRHVLELAGDLGATACNHVSSAYVGDAGGEVLREEPVPPDAPCGNAYERSKLEAEHVVAGADFERTRIFRPGIVVGHSTTRAAAAPTRPHRLVRDLCSRIEGLGERLRRHSLRLLADPDAPLGWIPVDRAASAAVGVSRSDSAERIFHLTGAAPPRLGEVLAVAAERVGLLPPTFAASAGELTDLDRQVDEQLAPYRPYTDARVLDRSHTEAALGEDSGDDAFGDEAIAAHVDWHLRRGGGRDSDCVAAAEVS